MSRDQKPARVKLVASSTDNPGRRAGDAVSSQTASTVSAAAGAPASATERKGGGLILSLLFLAACAAGGAGAVYLGFDGSVVE